MKKYILYFLVISIYLYPRSYYVDKNATGNNSGTSWANAWESFSDINWGLSGPGDTLFISGGTDSLIYSEELSVGSSGTSGNPITIIAGKYSTSPSGHNGRVIIDGGLSRTHSIYVQNKNYVTIKGVECRHATMGIEIDDNAICIVLDSLNIYDYQGQAGIMISGANTYTIDSTTIRNCRIVSYPMYNGQTDGVYAQRCQRTLFHNNYIHQRNQDPNAHTDCLQAYLTNGWVIYNNFFINDSVYSPEGGGTPMILGSEGTNPVIIYNNFLYMGGIWDPNGSQNSCLWTRWYDNNPMPPTWVIHNTIVVNGPRCRSFIQEYDAITINNILAIFSTSSGMANLEESLPNAISVDSTRHNLFWHSWFGVGFSGQFTGNGNTGGVSEWSSWTGTYGGTGVNADPLFVHKIGYEPDQGALDGELQVGSSAINAGEDAQSCINNLNSTYNLTGDWALQWKDINGNPRDNTPTIGAYQYNDGSESTFSFSININNGWNMVSAPGTHPDVMGVGTWWAHHTGTVWGFNGNSYVSKTVATPGDGYWMKNSLAETYVFPTIEIVPHDPITATTGWNMLGGYETSPTITALKSANPQITGTVWGFTGGGYIAATNLVPGYAYWVKTTNSNAIVIPDVLAKDIRVAEKEEYIKEDWGKITITDAEGRSYTLYSVKGEVNLNDYELPPAPPAGMFDVRFGSGRYAEMVGEVNQSIELNNLAYPVKVRIENMGIRLQDETGKGLNERLKAGEEVIISNNAISKLMVSSDAMPDKYALEQNYPNPFNPSTKIEFSIPEDVNNVTLTIYNALGQRVAELVNSKMEAGKYSYIWNASNLATGLYIYELRTDKFVSVKKMMLLK